MVDIPSGCLSALLCTIETAHVAVVGELHAMAVDKLPGLNYWQVCSTS